MDSSQLLGELIRLIAIHGWMPIVMDPATDYVGVRSFYVHGGVLHIEPMDH